MDKFSFLGFTRCDELPYDKFENVKFSVYVLDTEWNYLYVNDFVKQNLGTKGENLKGKNMWTQFPQLETDANFSMIKENTEKGTSTNTIITSPITGQRINVVGYPLTDCFFFFSSILPTKEDLLLELRKELGR